MHIPRRQRICCTRQHHAAIAQRLASFHPADIAFVLESLPEEARELAFGLAPKALRGAVLLETSDGIRRALFSRMNAADVEALTAQLDPEDIADLAASLPEEIRDSVLERLDRREQAEVRSVLPPHTTQLFVVDREQRLRGLLPLERVVLGEPDALVRDEISVAPVAFYTDDPMREAG